jgi:predicted dehydrogenase
MPVGVAVAGLGAIGRLHATNLARHLPDARLVRVIDRLPAVASKVGAELAVPHSDSYVEALADRTIDAVVVATPSPLHAEMVEAAAHAGKHVFCEKPLALDPAAGARAAAAAHRVCLQVGFQRRFDPDWVAAKRSIDAGEVGEVLLFHVSHRNRCPPPGPDGAGRLGSLFVDMSIHDMDSARWLVGEIRTINAFATPWPGRDDVETAVILLEFAGGGLGVVENTRVAGYGFDCRAELMGRRSTLRIGAGHRPVDLERLMAGGALVPTFADHIERHRTGYLAELRHFVDCLRTGSRPVVGAEEALAALELSLGAERSYRECNASH